MPRRARSSPSWARRARGSRRSSVRSRASSRCARGTCGSESGSLDAAPGAGTHVTPSRRGVVLLGQDPRLFPHLSAHENVAFGLLARGIPKRVARARKREEWLSRVGPRRNGRRRPAELSGGQQQRVAIARALATAPAALLLDEPLTSLDTETAADLRAMLREQLSATHTTAVVATHDAVDSVSLADGLVVVEDGRVTQAGRVRDVLRAPASRFVAAVSGLNRVVGAVRGGAVVERGDVARPSARRGAATWPRSSRRGPFSSSPPSPPRVRTAPAQGEWIARVTRLEQTPAGVRVRTAEPEVAVDLSGGPSRRGGSGARRSRRAAGRSGQRAVPSGLTSLRPTDRGAPRP